MEQSKTIYLSTNNSIKKSTIENEIGPSTGNSNSTGRQDFGNGTENERQRSKTSFRQCRLLPSGPVADIGRDLLMRELKIVGGLAYSVRQSATTELAKLGIPERDLATLTHHTQNS
ncbi:MAG: hypothetical protein EZS28_047174, partial [Streblomastix strix]